MFKKTYVYLGLLIGLCCGRSVLAPVDFKEYTTSLTNAKNNSNAATGLTAYKTLLGTLNTVAKDAVKSNDTSTLNNMKSFITGNGVSLVNVLKDKTAWKTDTDLRTDLKALAAKVNHAPTTSAVSDALGDDAVKGVVKGVSGSLGNTGRQSTRR